MKYLAAYCLLALGEKENISADDVKKVLKEVGAEVNDGDLNRVIDSLKGKKLHEVITQGLSKVGSLAMGAGASAPAEKADKKGKDDKKEKAKEEKKPEPKKEEPKKEEEEDFGGAADLFGGF